MYFWKEKNTNRASGFLKQAKDLEGNLKNWFLKAYLTNWRNSSISMIYFAIFTIWHWEKTLCQYHFLYLLCRSLHMFRSSFVKIIINSFQHYYEIHNAKTKPCNDKKNPAHNIFIYCDRSFFFYFQNGEHFLEALQA